MALEKKQGANEAPPAEFVVKRTSTCGVSNACQVNKQDGKLGELAMIRGAKQARKQMLTKKGIEQDDALPATESIYSETEIYTATEPLSPSRITHTQKFNKNTLPIAYSVL